MPASLSVCCLTSSPGARLEALLAPLRRWADEIVVLAAPEVGEREVGAYRATADRVLRWDGGEPAESVDEGASHSTQALAWLEDECSSDWILRLEDDEVAGVELLAELPGLLERADVDEHWIPSRWPFPDAGHWLAEPPWWPGYQRRLRRRETAPNDSASAGCEDPRPVRREYVPWPLHKLTCLLSSESDRLRRAVREEVLAPGARGPGGAPRAHGLLLPERYARRRTDALPAADRAVIEAVLARAGSRRRALPRIRRLARPPNAASPGPLYGPDGTAPGDQGEARAPGSAPIVPHEEVYRMHAGERRELYFQVTNADDQAWPGPTDTGPAIRASYRWQEPDGAARDGVRTPFPRMVAPGETLVVGVMVQAPPTPGRHRLEVDVVHEDVRWLGPGCALAVEVTPVPELIEVYPRRGRRRSARLPWGAISARRTQPAIPRVIHQVWLGEAPLPDRMLAWRGSWERHHPAWSLRVWRDDDAAALIDPACLARARSLAERSNLVRYELLARVGGVYVDTDVECRRPLDPLLAGVSAFAACELPGRVGSAVLGAVPGHPALLEASELAQLTAGTAVNSVNANGPYFLTLVLARHPEVTIFEPRLFYPYAWTEPWRSDDAFPEAYAVHRWEASWR